MAIIQQNASDLSEILHVRTLKHANENAHMTLRKHRTTSILLTFKVHDWKCTVARWKNIVANCVKQTIPLIGLSLYVRHFSLIQEYQKIVAKVFNSNKYLPANLIFSETMVCYVYTTPWQRRVVDDNSKRALS